MRKAMAVLAAAGAIALLLVAGKLLLTGASFSPGNPSWDGTSAVALRDRAVPAYGFGQLRAAGPSDTLLIIGPSIGYDAQDAAEVSRFLLNGGRAIVMDDYGTANTLLEGLGAPVEIGRVPLCQDVEYCRSPALPLAGDIVPCGLTRGVDRLAFNHPVALQLSGDAVPLARTSPRAWLDGDDNGTFDGAETFGAYVLIARAGYGKGELIVAGDADLLVNGMLKKGDNGALLDNIMEGGTVYVDAAHGQAVPPLARLYFAIRSDLLAQAACIVATLALAGVSIRLCRPRGRGEEARASPPLARRSLIAAMRAGLPLSERDIKALDKKL